MNWNSPVFFVDGGCRGNHKKGNREAYGSISDGENVLRYKWDLANSNNEAEFGTLYQLLETLRDFEIDPTKGPTVYMDSKLVVNSLTKGWKIKAPNLVKAFQMAKRNVELTGVKLVWVPRHIIEEKVGH